MCIYTVCSYHPHNIFGYLCPTPISTIAFTEATGFKPISSVKLDDATTFQDKESEPHDEHAWCIKFRDRRPLSTALFVCA